MLAIHILAGAMVLLFGVAALCYKKGSARHRLSGNLFFPAMVFVAISSMFISEDPTMPILSLYYALTAWVTVIRKEKTSGYFEVIAMLAIAWVSYSLFTFVFTTPDLNPVFRFIFIAHAIIAALAALLDLHFLFKGGLSGKHRIIRHGWRTCFALLGAVMSFSANTSDYWPEFINDNLLIYLTLGVLLFWTSRLLFTKWFEDNKSNFSKPMIKRYLIGIKSYNQRRT